MFFHFCEARFLGRPGWSAFWMRKVSGSSVAGLGPESWEADGDLGG